MSRVALIVAVLVMLGLGALSAFVLLGRGPGGGARPAVGVVAIADADLESMRVEYATGEPIEVRRGPLADLWLMSEGERVYPAQSARVRAMLRVLGEAKVSPAGDLSGEAVAATVRLRRRAGSEAVVRIAGEPLGGRGPVIVEIDGAAVSMLVPDAVHKLFARGNLRAWMSNAVFPAGTGGAGRLVLRAGEEEGGGGLTLGRSGTRWGLLEPVRSAADAGAVAATLAGLDRATHARFVDGAETGAGGARVTIETEMRELEGEVLKRRVLVQSLEAVGRGGEGLLTVRLEGRLREADGSEAALWGGVAEVRSDALAELSVRSERYLSPVSYADGAGDVGAIGVGVGAARSWFRRDVEVWVRGEVGGEGGPLSGDDAARVRQAIELLCAARADRSVSARELAFEPTVGVWLGTAAGAPLAEFGVGLIAGDDGRAVVAVRSGEVVRLYGSPAARAVVEWLAGQG